MTDDPKNTEEIEEIAQSAPAPDEYPEGQAETLESRIEEEGEPNGLEKGVVSMVEETEAASDSAPAQAFDSAVSSIQAGIENVMEPAPETPAEALHSDHAHHGDVTVFRGKTYDMPLYTSVFLLLGFLTIIEVLIAEIISSDTITIPVLMTIAIFKAGLVVYYYMHLNTDSRVFALTLLLPIAIGLLSALFLFAIPTGY